MYTGALGRVNALEFRSPDRAASKSQLSNPVAVVPTSNEVLQRAFSKVKEIALTSPECANYSEAELLACLSLPSPKKISVSLSTASPELKQPSEAASSGGTLDSEHYSMNTLLNSLNQLDLSRSPTTRTPLNSPVHAKSQAFSSLQHIPEALDEDYSPRPSIEEEYYEEESYPQRNLSILSVKDAHRLLRGGGSIASRVKQRQQPSMAELEAAKIKQAVQKINRQSIVRRTTLRRPTSRVSFADEALFVMPPPAPKQLPKKQQVHAARGSTIASHKRKVLVRHEKQKQSRKSVMDATKRVSNMKLGTSPKKCKIKHEDLITYCRRNCKAQRGMRRQDFDILKAPASHVSLDVVDRIGTRAACPVHLITEQPKVDFSHVSGVVNSYNTPRRKSKRIKHLKRPSLWIAKNVPHNINTD
ncbi:hypothetical protein THRCLA_23419 [Thraustotheca clavata]|uniref:Uncharacterized protein n=1 Tax=Thraustotheca clavata TaxID=74557 RepID=A0A1V9Y5R4_9STRA|nr:hypothetical protein THRCLA_23419 [Thraustotheca clavata]